MTSIEKQAAKPADKPAEQCTQITYRRLGRQGEDKPGPSAYSVHARGLEAMKGRKTSSTDEKTMLVKS